MTPRGWASGRLGDASVRHRRDGATGNRLAVFVDAGFRIVPTAGDRRVYARRPFLLFVCEVGRHFASLTLLGREDSGDEQARVPLPPHADLLPLPHYPDVRHVGRLMRVAGRTAVRMWRGLDRADVVWVFGPNPFGVLLALLALLRRRRVVMGIRQDGLAYFRARLPSRWWAPAAVVPAWLLHHAHRLLADRLPTTAVGPAARRAGGSRSRAPLTAMTVLLLRADEIGSAPPERDWSGPVRLLTVGRMEPEKNPFLLLEALARLERDQPGRHRLTWIGGGRCEARVRARAAELGLDRLIEFPGYVPFGPPLLARYHEADLFVHVSLTEGTPQVIMEAFACGTPVIATDVGGVAAALGDGSAGLLVPPRDADALVQAIRTMSGDPALRSRMVAHGLRLARAAAMDVEASRIAGFIRGDPAT